jgi:hypothetical protein
MFAPAVDSEKRAEVSIRQATTKNRRVARPDKAPVAIPEEPKTIPPGMFGFILALNFARVGEMRFSRFLCLTAKLSFHENNLLPEARGKVKPKELEPGNPKHGQTLVDKDTVALQFGKIRIVKSAKQVVEDREANVAQWQTRAKAILNAITQKEAQLTADTLAPLHIRFAKHSMVTEMYCDTISAKLDLLSELCNM